MSSFKQLKLEELKKIVQTYNLETKINLSKDGVKLKKSELINEIEKHLFIDTDNTIKYKSVKSKSIKIDDKKKDKKAKEEVKENIKEIMEDKEAKQKVEKIEDKLDIQMPITETVKNDLKATKMTNDIVNKMRHIQSNKIDDLLFIYINTTFKDTCDVIPVINKKSEDSLKKFSKEEAEEVRNYFIYLNQIICVINNEHEDYDDFYNYIVKINKRKIIKNAKYSLFYNDALLKTIEKCNKRFIVIPVSIVVIGGNGHSNVLLIDKQNKTLELYEPHGFQVKINDKLVESKTVDKIYTWYINTDELVNKFADMIDYKYLSPMTSTLSFDVINKSFSKLYLENKETQGLQMLEEDYYGFCSLWSIFYVYLRLSNPDYDVKQILKKLILFVDENPKLLMQVLFNFILKIDNELNIKIGDYMENKKINVDKITEEGKTLFYVNLIKHFVKEHNN